MPKAGEAGEMKREGARRCARADPLQTLASVVDFEVFRAQLLRHVGGQERSGVAEGGFDVLVLFKLLILQILHEVTLEEAICLLDDRRSWRLFCGLDPAGPVPSAEALWGFKDALVRALALEGLIAEFDRHLTEAGYLAMTGHISDMRVLPIPGREGSAGRAAGTGAAVSGTRGLPPEPTGARKSLLDVAAEVRRDSYAHQGIELNTGAPPVGSKPLAEVLGERRVAGLSINLESMALLSNIHRASLLIRHHFEKHVLSEADLYWSAFVALWCLWIYGDLETRRLANEMGVPKSTVSTVLKLLEGRGLVLRRRNERERRLVIATLTDTGQALISDLFPKFNAEETRIASGLSDEQIQTATTAIRMILLTIGDLGAEEGGL